MTEDETEVVGWFADELLTHPHFQTIVGEFERSAMRQLLDTIPPAAAEREEIYFTYNGAKAFLDFLRNLKDAKNTIAKKRAIQAVIDEGLAEAEEDAQLEDPTDDDGYHF